MREISKLPSVIEFLGQTYVMPGTLSRLWCIFEMAYSLQYNKQIIYYQSGDIHDEASIADLLARDQEQLSLESSDMLKCAECFKDKDRSFIFGVIDKGFAAREDAINLIKGFIPRDSETDDSRRDSQVEHL